MSSIGGDVTFIRMKKVDPNRPHSGVVSAATIAAYRPFGSKDRLTEVVLNNGHSFISNETVPEFENRLNHAVNPYIVD